MDERIVRVIPISARPRTGRRNREKFPAYMEAAEEMFARASTEGAPWQYRPGRGQEIRPA